MTASTENEYIVSHKLTENRAAPRRAGVFLSIARFPSFSISFLFVTARFSIRLEVSRHHYADGQEVPSRRAYRFQDTSIVSRALSRAAPYSASGLALFAEE